MTRNVGLAVVVAAVLAACARDRAPIGTAAPATREGERGCASCHADVAREWEASFHHVSFTDATFQVGLANEEPRDRAACVGCHAPSPRGASAGVDCLVCHDSRFEAPHARADAALRARTCDGCHEFSFEDNPGEMMQATASEHAASAYASVACVDCHMPARDGHRDHRFRASHALDVLRASVRVEARAAGEGAVHVKIVSTAGHAFPTGDMFRRVRLDVFAEGVHGEIVGDAQRVFERRWSALERGERPGARTQVGDTRVRGTWEETLALHPTAPVARVRWELRYERPVVVNGPRALLASSDVIAEGQLANEAEAYDAERDRDDGPARSARR